MFTTGYTAVTVKANMISLHVYQLIPFYGMFSILASNLSATPFPQIDIIGAMVTVWRVRGEIIKSVLCSIVCNSCAQCNARTYEQTNSSLDWVLSHWAHFTVLRFIFMYVCMYVFLYHCILHACVVL